MAPNSLPAVDGAGGCLGELSRPGGLPTHRPLWAGRTRGRLSRGQGVFALLPSLPCPCSPAYHGHHQPGGCCSDSCTRSWRRGWCSATRARLPGGSLTTSQRGNSVLHPGKKNSGPAARRCGDPAGCQQKHQDEGPAGLPKCGVSHGEEEGQPHRSPALREAPATL